MSSKKVSGGRVWVSVEDSRKLSFMHRSVYLNVPFSPIVRVKVWVVLMVYPVVAVLWGISKLVTMFNS